MSYCLQLVVNNLKSTNGKQKIDDKCGTYHIHSCWVPKIHVRLQKGLATLYQEHRLTSHPN